MIDEIIKGEDLYREEDLELNLQHPILGSWEEKEQPVKETVKGNPVRLAKMQENEGFWQSLEGDSGQFHQDLGKGQR